MCGFYVLKKIIQHPFISEGDCCFINTDLSQNADKSVTFFTDSGDTYA